MCECFGTTQPFFRYTCASISWSPVMRRRDSLSCRTSRSMSSQRYHVARSALTAILHDGGERQRYGLGESASKRGRTTCMADARVPTRPRSLHQLQVREPAPLEAAPQGCGAARGADHRAVISLHSIEIARQDQLERDLVRRVAESKSRAHLEIQHPGRMIDDPVEDRKSTRLNSSH